MQFREQRLDNGLEIVAECNPNAYSAAFAFFVKTGSRDETDELSGVSHFLEHMVFKGTARRSAADVNRELDEIGSQSNAFTSEEQTVYYATVLPEYQDRALDLLADILRPALREDDFEMEKKVILEEIAKYEDQPPFGAHEKVMAAHFGSHPLGRNVLGSVATVSALTPERMREYFERRYSPGNIVLAAAGNVDFDRMVAMIREQTAGWQPRPTPRETPRAPHAASRQVFPKAEASQQYVVQICNGPSAEDADRYAGRVLATVIGDDSGSRYFWDIVDPGLADSAAMAAYEFQGTGVFMTFLSGQPDDTADNVSRMRAIADEVQRSGITEAELTLAQNKICSHVVLQSERPSSRLFSVGNNWLQRRKYRTVRESVESYRAVTLSDVSAVLERFPITDMTAVAVGPLRELAW